MAAAAKELGLLSQNDPPSSSGKLNELRRRDYGTKTSASGRALRIAASRSPVACRKALRHEPGLASGKSSCSPLAGRKSPTRTPPGQTNPDVRTAKRTKPV